MADIVDKAILLGLGLEKKARETLIEMESAGREERGPDRQDGLGAKEELENRAVETGVRVTGEILSLLKECKGRVDGEVGTGAEKLIEKFNLVSRDDYDVVMEMARLAREKVDALEKRVEALEVKKKKTVKKTPATKK